MTIDPKEIVSKLRAGAHNKQANLTVPADPSEKGTVKIKDHEGDDPKKQKIPADGTPDGADSTAAAFAQKELNAGGNSKVNSKAKSDCTKAATAREKLASIRATVSGKATTPTTTPENTPENTDTQKKANTTPTPEFNQEMMLKLASTMLESEEGIQAARKIIQKSAGYEAARTIIESASKENQGPSLSDLTKQATQKGIDHINTCITELNELGVTPEIADNITKVAAYHEALTQQHDEFSHPLMKRAYAGGMEDAAAMEDAAMGGGEPAIPGAGPEVSDEDILAVLQLLVESGEVSEEDAAAFLEAILGGAEGGGEVPPEAEAAAPPVE